MSELVYECLECKGKGEKKGKPCPRCSGCGNVPTEEGKAILALVSDHLQLYYPCSKCEGTGLVEDAYPCIMCAETGGTATPFGKRLAHFWQNFCNQWNTAKKHVEMTCHHCNGTSQRNGEACHCVNGHMPTTYGKAIIQFARSHVEEMRPKEPENDA